MSCICSISLLGACPGLWYLSCERTPINTAPLIHYLHAQSWWQARSFSKEFVRSISFSSVSESQTHGLCMQINKLLVASASLLSFPPRKLALNSGVQSVTLWLHRRKLICVAFSFSSMKLKVKKLNFTSEIKWHIHFGKGWVQRKWVWLLYPWINPVHEIYKLMLPCYFCWTYVGHSELSSCLLPLPDQTTC